jgi:hypothetical protein
VPAPPQGAQRKKSSTGLVVGCGLLALVGLIGVGGAGAYWAMSNAGGGGSALPGKLGKYPKNTGYITHRTLQSSLFLTVGDSASAAAKWSSLSHLCGGSDTYWYLVRANRPSSRERLGRDLTEHKLRTKETLSCGKELFEHNKENHETFVVRFSEGADKHVVTLYKGKKGKLANIPSDFRQTSDVGEFTYCRLPSKDAFVCADDAHTLAYVGDHWVSGELKAVKAFSREYSSKGDNQVDASESIQSIAKLLAKHENTRIHAGATSQLLFLLSFAYHGVLLDDATEKGLQEAIDLGAKAFGYGETVTTEKVVGKFIVEAKNEATAKNIEQALTTYTREVGTKAAAQATKEASEKASEGEHPSETEWRKAERAISRRALTTATIKVEGTRVTMSIDLTPSADEKRVRMADLAARAGTFAYSTKAVEKLQRGEALTDAELSALGGKALVDEVKNPGDRSTDSELPVAMRKSVEVPSAYGFRVPTGGSYTYMPPKGEKSAAGHNYKYPTTTSDQAVAAILWTLEVNKRAGWSCEKREGIKGMVVEECSRLGNTVRAGFFKGTGETLNIMVVDIT